METKVTQNVGWSWTRRSQLSLQAATVLTPISAPVLQSHHKQRSHPCSCQVWPEFHIHLGLVPAAADQVTYKQWTPTCLPKTEQPVGKRPPAQTLFQNKILVPWGWGWGPTAHPERPGDACWNQKGPAWGQKRYQTDGRPGSDHRALSKDGGDAVEIEGGASRKRRRRW